MMAAIVIDGDIGEESCSRVISAKKQKWTFAGVTARRPEGGGGGGGGGSGSGGGGGGPYGV